MVAECGMSEDIGPVFVENTESPDMRRRIDGEISRILREAYGRVKALLVRCLTTDRSKGDREGSAAASAAGRAEKSWLSLWRSFLLSSVRNALQRLCMRC